MQTETPIEEPTNGNLLGTGMIIMGHMWINLTLTVQEAIRDYQRLQQTMKGYKSIRDYKRKETTKKV